MQSSVLFAAWSRWCVGEGLEPGTNKALTTALQNRGFDNTKSRGRTVWQDLGVITESEER